MSILNKLVAFYELEEASGARANAVGSATLSEVGGAVESAAGRIGQGATFLKSPGHYLATSIRPFTLGDFDLNATLWMRPTLAVSGGDYHGVVSYNPWSGGFQVGYNYDGAAFANLSNGYQQPLGITIHAAGSVPLNQWSFIVLRFDAVNDVVYIQSNGGAMASAGWANGMRADAEGVPLSIGHFKAGQFSTFQGEIDQVGIWLSPPGGGAFLSTDDTGWLYNAGAGRSYAEMVAHWGIDAPSGVGIPAVMHHRRQQGMS